MSHVVCIAGESGTGKTTSMRNLNPETTLYIDCDKKGLSWKGWKAQFNGEKKNYLVTDFPQVALQALKKVNEQAAFRHIRVVVVDTLNGLMVADEMRRTKEKGYDKWQDLAQSIYDLVDYSLTMRDDVTVVFVAHMPSSFSSSSIESIASISSNERSGAIFSTIGIRGTPSFFERSSFAFETVESRFGR